MKKILIIIIIILILPKVFAQDLQIPDMIKNLTDQSFQKYPKVLEMQDLVHLSEIRVSLNKAGFFPIANGNVSYTRLYPTDPIAITLGPKIIDFQIVPADNYNVGVTLVQPIINLKTSANINKSKSDMTASIDNLENFKLQLAYQVAQIYYGIVFLNKSLHVQRQQLDLIQTNIRQIEAKVKNGDALTYDLVSMQVRYTNVENFYTDLQNQINKQYNLLNMLCGNSESITISDTTIIDKGFDIETDSIFAMAVVNNPDIKIANYNIESARLVLESTSRDQLPSLNMLAGTGYRNGFMPDVFTTRFNYYVGVSLNIPIFSSSRPGYQRKIALVNLNASRSALETQQITLNKDILNALEDVKKNKNKLAGSDTLIMQATLALRLATDRYKNGVITTLELLTAQTNYQDALLSRLQYEYNLLLAKMEINRLTGKRWW